MANNQSNENSRSGPKNTLDKLKRGLIKVGKYEFEIPEYRFDLLYISTEEPRNVNAGSFKLNFSITEDGINLQEIPKDEPSTIYLQLEIEKPSIDDTIEELGYFPNYAGMDKNQRWVYLNWLQDVKKNINISFVFTYYYGLERILATEDFEKAFKEINLLRKYHDNHSFQGYSLHALIQSACNKFRAINPYDHY